MVTDDIIDALFVIAPYTEVMKVPRSFVLRLSPAGQATLNAAVEACDTRAYRVACDDGTLEYFSAIASRSPYGFIQLTPVSG